MAGEWIKFECSLPEKPEVMAITTALGWDDPDLTVGKLMRLFRWFDQQTLDGNAVGVTPALLDRLIGVTGFVQALQDVRWIEPIEGGLCLRNFGKHNGETAKARAQTAKRVATHRSNANTVTPALAREEKRREEKKEDKPPSGVTRASRKCPESFEVTEELLSWAKANAPSVDAIKATDKFRDYTFKNAISDWPGAWRNWIRRDQEDAEKRAPANKLQALEDRNRAVARKWAEENRESA